MTTAVAFVTPASAALVSTTLPVIAIAFVMLIAPLVASLIAFKSAAVIATAAASDIVTVALDATTLLVGVTNAAVT